MGLNNIKVEYIIIYISKRDLLYKKSYSSNVEIFSDHCNDNGLIHSLS